MSSVVVPSSLSLLSSTLRAAEALPRKNEFQDVTVRSVGVLSRTRQSRSSSTAKAVKHCILYKIVRHLHQFTSQSFSIKKLRLRGCKTLELPRGNVLPNIVFVLSKNG